jgi:hypothetical protein
VRLFGAIRRVISMVSPPQVQIDPDDLIKLGLSLWAIAVAYLFVSAGFYSLLGWFQR